MTRAREIIDVVNRIAPPALAAAGDPAGLHAGDPEREVTRVLLTVDAGLAVVEEAVRVGAELIIAHHPRFYRGLATLAETDANGRRGAAIARAGVVLFSAHTALDLAPGGTNDALAALAGLVDARPVTREGREQLVKLAVFVPRDHLEAVRRAVCAAGAGCIGAYSDCTFRVEGTGGFRCGPDTAPFIGAPGTYEEVAECRLETVLPESRRDAVVAALLAAHPYEEAAYDLYPLVNAGPEYGFGRVGELPRPERLGALARRLAHASGSGMAQLLGDAEREVRRAAVWAGGGVEAGPLVATGAEVVVAGEVGYHETEAFADAGVGLITLGHGYSELPVLAGVATRLRAAFPGIPVAIAAEPVLGMKNCFVSPPGGAE